MAEPQKIVVVEEWPGKWLINESYRPIAEQLCEKFKEISHISVNEILFIDDTESNKVSKGKRVFAQIGKIPAKWAEVLEQTTKRRYYYFMEIFKQNTEQLSREQLIAVIYHELRHIGTDGKLVDHEINDWINMIDKLGPIWAITKGEIPDLLDDKIVNWESITGPITLFPVESKLQVVK